jgi:phage N-6-adenine-methyltransferase
MKIEYEYHEDANKFDLLQGEEFDLLVNDIKKNGQIYPITIHNDKILDGRNRYRACLAAGIEPIFYTYQGDDTRGYIVSLNLIRRMLTDAERARLLVELYVPCTHGYTTVRELAKQHNISTTQAQRVKNVSIKAIPEVKDAYLTEKISLRKAGDLARLPAKEQKDNLIVTKYTGNEEWYTPKKYIDMAREVLGRIDIDPASNEFANKVVQATTYYTKEDDGLTKEWQGKMWLNPPYSSIIAKFIDKTCNSDVEAIVLTNNSTDTKWFAQAANNCDAICFTYGRINFYDDTDKKSSPTNGQAFFYFGDNIEKFNQVFREIGFVVRVI